MIAEMAESARPSRWVLNARDGLRAVVAIVRAFTQLRRRLGAAA